VPALKVLPTPAPPHLTKTEPKASPEKKHPFGTEEEKKFVEKLQVEIGRKVDSLGAKIDIKVQVKVTGEGVLIILEDGRGRSMFAVGSAQPNPALIEILEEVGSLLSGRPEDVIIRGHTDARQFRNKTYDNWQLSTARAHMASYMLMRGGLPERRLKKVEGFGSSSPIDPENTMADSNRRVEFLLAHKG
jgi:chemotaxis protein MotB